MNALQQLGNHGQGFWLDNLSRAMIADGSLQRRIDEQGLSGITSNPAIFNQAITGSALYDERIRWAMQGCSDTAALYEALAVEDVRDACDLLQPVYERSDGADGFVSLEVSPHLAHDRLSTLVEARRLWAEVERPNLLIKVPGTPAGLQAVEELLFEGINVNITLLFDLESYQESLLCYFRALDRRLEAGRDVHAIASVASFFLSRIDTAVDAVLRQRLYAGIEPALRGEAEALLGKAALAQARLAYRLFEEALNGHRWRHLAEAGARPQRIVWASTGTKDPDYSDIKYVEALVAADTVSTMPEATAAAFVDHGRVASVLTQEPAQAEAVIAGLGRLGIDLDAITHTLVNEGVEKFVSPYEAVLEHLTARRERIARAVEHAPLADTAQRLRADCIRMTTAAGSGHPTSCLSSAELVASLFFHEMRWDPATPGARDTDRFLLSKGHAAPILWAALREAGAISEDLESLRQLDSSLEGHPTTLNPWVQAATGSLGQGLAVANGMAMADRLDGLEGRIFCLLGDGECSEGSVWEAAQLASAQKLERLVAIVDVNGLQQSGPAPYGSDTSVLAARFRAFGWRAVEIDGHDIGQVVLALEQSREPGPLAIVARTVKGKGVSFLEGREGWHGKALNTEQARQALAELGESEPPPRVTAHHIPAHPRPQEPVARRPLTVDYPLGSPVATRTAFGSALVKLGERMPELVVLDGDVKNSTRTDLFAEAFPERFIEAQIAEQGMLGAALGLAVSGKHPCVATFAAFLTRAHDFIRMAVHSRVPNLLVCGSHAGVSIGQDGASQMGLEDIALFRALEGSTILYPSDAVSAERLTEVGMMTPGLVYLRTTRGETPVIYGPEERFPVGGSKTLVSSPGDVLTLVAAGITVHAALEAHQKLLAQGVVTRVIDAYSVKPLDVETLERAAHETRGLLVVEDHNMNGGLGDAVAAQIGRHGRVFRLGVSGEPHSATPEELLEMNRLSSRAIEQEALAVAA